MELLRLWMSVLGALTASVLVWTLPADEDRGPTAEEAALAEGYLRRFYELRPGGQRSARRVRSAPAVGEKLRRMQSFFGLRATGLLDPPTLDVMREPRCGVPDVENFSFYHGRPKWRNPSITYTIAKYTPDMKKEDVRKALRLALKMWSDAAPLRFTRVDQHGADIVFSFARRTHGDFFPFDGPRGVLAHAFQPGPGLGGDVHFDEDETWTAGRTGHSLLAVAAHELGHALGLSHSRDPAAVMYPNYRYQSGAQHSLSKDDTRGIQTLYGRPAPPRKAGAPPAPQKCDPNLSLDAAAVIGNEIVFFKSRHMWMRTTRANYLRESPSGAYLPGIASHVDAAYDVKGVAYVFTGRQYWAVQKLKVRGRAGSIHEYGFPAGVRQVDAAVHVGDQAKTFFFAGDVYYRYDERRKKMDAGFPRVTRKDWPGIPGRIDAAFQLEGNIFLFSGTMSYQYDLRRKRVANVIPANSWLGC